MHQCQHGSALLAVANLEKVFLVRRNESDIRQIYARNRLLGDRELDFIAPAPGTARVERLIEKLKLPRSRHRE